MGAVTTSLRFTPFVLKLPVRPPVLVAKQAASIAALTGNRLALGVGSARGRRTSRSWACRFERGVGGWTSASTWCAA